MNKLSNKKLLNKKRNRAPYSNEENKEKSSSICSSSTINEANILVNYTKNNSKLFKKNPNLKFNQDILNSNETNGFNDLFEVYISIKNNNLYLVSPNIVNYNLDIISLKEKQLVKSLKGHTNHITTVRYFTNNLKEYLISADIKNLVIIWDISDENNKKFKIELKYSNWIYSCLLIFDIDIIIFTSCCGVGNTKMFLLNNNKITFCYNIINSKKKNIYYLLDWYNEKENKYYLIEFCRNKILVINFNSNKLYANLFIQNSKDYCYISGFIYNTYLFSNSTNGYINIWDLYEKKLINSINVYNSIITNCIQWNEKYIILIDGKNNSLKILNIEKGVIISNIISQHENGIICIKKIEHPIYGESLLSSGQDGYLKLWTIK